MGFLVFVLCFSVVLLWNRVSNMKKELAGLKEEVSGLHVDRSGIRHKPWGHDQELQEGDLPRRDDQAERVASVPAAGSKMPKAEEQQYKPKMAMDVKLVRSTSPAPVQQASEVRAETSNSGSSQSNEEAGGFENLFGRTLPIWAGGIVLAITGILGVKWSIDAGILSEGVRVFLGVLFGGGLISGAFAMKARDDERIAQALSGAGVASLYGAILSAHLLYGLIGTGTAMVGMGAVTVIGGILSMTFGAPSALLALVGGLAAPALIGGESNVPLLTLYVAAVTAGAATLGRLQKRTWLSMSALGGGLLWVLVAAPLATGSISVGFVVALALFCGLVLPVLSGSGSDGAEKRLDRIGAIIAIIQCAGLVVAGGFGAVQWLGLAIATGACLVLSWKSRTEILAVIAGGVVFAVLLAWPDAGMVEFAVAVAVFGLAHAAHAVLMLKKGTAVSSTSSRLLCVPIAGALALVIHRAPETGLASGLILLASSVILAGLIEFVGRSQEIRTEAFQAIAVAFAAAGFWWTLDDSVFALAVAGVGALALLRRDWLEGAATAICIVTVSSVIAALPWLRGSFEALAGQPFFVSKLPQADILLQSLVPLVAICGYAAWNLRERMIVLPALFASIAGTAMGIMVHLAVKSLFSIENYEEFVRLGMLERVSWELLLCVAASLAWKYERRLAVVLGAISLAHFGVFSLILHNPAYTDQAVGPAPIANLVGLSFTMAIGLVFAAGRLNLTAIAERVRRYAQMALIVLGVFMLIRQMFAGSIMTGVPIGQGEDILYSIASIAIALGLLVYGLRTHGIEWRTGSLVIMLVAVVKVFAFDAAGLDGLARIASFAALGFALIGVGWLYAKLLPSRQ